MRISVEQIGGTETVLADNGSTVGQVTKLATSRDPEGYTAQVNGSVAGISQVLNDGDLLSIVPTKVKGARA